MSEGKRKRGAITSLRRVLRRVGKKACYVQRFPICICPLAALMSCRLGGGGERSRSW
jgi:hypothetical protein